MTIKERYKELTQKKLILTDFQDIVELKNDCKVEMNQEYLYLCDILIIDLYINENLYDDSLAIIMKSLNNIDNIVFQKIYVSFLERAIYIFIQKKNFKSAYRYAFMKRNYIDLDNIDEINRWYLEMAYIYAELNQKDKALLNLKAILSNYPNESLKALTLSNMTKLYIDQEQISEAKNSLSDCITLVYQLNDEEGIMYCDYLNAKLHILEKNFKLAKQGFQDIFKSIHTLTDDYLSIANEYISLLIEMDLYDEAYRISVKYLKSMEKSDDLYIKKDYYKNYLKIYILKNKNVRDDLRQLLKAIEVLETEIDKYDENIINESNEDDKNLEITSRIKEVISKVEKIVNIINIALKNDNERDCIMEFSKHLEEVIKFDEALYVVFAKLEFEVLPEFFDNFNKIDTYNYKKKRVYEREFSFNNLNKTVVEMLITANHEIMIDFNDSPIPVKNLITDKTYPENNVKSLIAIPLNYENQMFGCVIFTAHNNSLVDMDSMVNLKIAAKLLEFKLISLFYQESLRAQKSILQFITKNLPEGMFYMDPIKRKVFLTEQLAHFFAVENRSLSKDEYISKINEEDVNIYLNIDKFIDSGEPYKIEYRLNTENKEVLICEMAKPYISRDGIIKFYVGTITQLENPISIDHESDVVILSEDDFNNSFNQIFLNSRNIEYKCAFSKFKIDSMDEYDSNEKNRIIEYIYSVIQENFSDNTFYLNDKSIISIIEINDQRIIDKKVRNILNILDQGIIYNKRLLQFNVKAGVVRFPRDTYDVTEIIEFCNIALETNGRYQVFNDDIRKNYLKKQLVTTCINEHIKSDSLELLYLPLVTIDESIAYEVKYNIKGILPKESIHEFIDKKIIFPFEKLVLKNLIQEIKGNDARFYMHISCSTIEYLMNDEYFIQEHAPIYKKIILCIDDYSIYMNKFIYYLYNYGFKVNINYRVFNKLNVELLISNSNINGLFIDDRIQDRNKLLTLCNCMEYELLTNHNYSDYKNVIYRGEKLTKLS